ncbi:LytR C-terminal domain-containing protein [Streptomyces sp. NPDC048518]|uniref:LytR C-terminal domain-containing protein n=1 Tax=Streptomyces sp. NPDC048518 TaxID=3155029 RepID=UPI0033C99DD1
MSMLTPPGMGGEYRITGDKYPRMRRPNGRRRLVLAVIASTAALGLIGWGTLQLIDVFTGGHKASAAGSAAGDCDRDPDGDDTAGHSAASAAAAKGKAGKPLPKPKQITVNVFNATPRGGLAKSTADELKKRGFAIGKVGNATKEFDKKVKGTGMLLGAKAAADTSLPVLGTQLAGAELKSDVRKTGDVDLIIGNQFKNLAKKEDADKALAALAKPEPTSVPSGKKNC